MMDVKELLNLVENAKRKNEVEEKEKELMKYQLLYESDNFKLQINWKKMIKVMKKNDPESSYNKELRNELELQNETLKQELQNGECIEEELVKNTIKINEFKIANSLEEWQYAGMCYRNLQTDDDIEEVIRTALKVNGYKSLAYHTWITAKINGVDKTKKVSENIIPSLEKRFPPIEWNFEEENEWYIDVLDSQRAQLTE